MDTGWIAALATVVGGAATAILGAIAAMWLKVWPAIKESRELQAKLKADEEERKGKQESEKTEQTARIRHDAYEQVTAEYGEMLKDLRDDRSRFERKVDQLYEEMHKLSREHAECVANNERLRAHLSILQAEIESVRVKQDLAGLPTRMDAIVVANDKGVIIEWNQAATVLFHYKTREAIGMPVANLVPDRYLADHDAGWSDMLAKRRMPKRGPFRAEAKTKNGQIVPVEVTLSGWQENGRIFVSAAITPYVIPPGSQDVFQEDSPEAKATVTPKEPPEAA